MKTVVLLYDTSCIYEIVILNYFLKVTGKVMQFVSPDGKEITATEGYRITTSTANGYVDLQSKWRNSWNCLKTKRICRRPSLFGGNFGG